MKTILLTQGKATIVDDEDYEWLSQFKWYAIKQVRKNRTVWYAVRNVPGYKYQRKLYMHREILSVTDPNVEVDHENGNTLFNKKQNLRSATHGQNLQNQHKQIGCSSRFKGVYWNRKAAKWMAQIRVSGHQQNLGYFENEEAAAAAYDRAAKSEFGEFSLTNQKLLLGV